MLTGYIGDKYFKCGNNSQIKFFTDTFIDENSGKISYTAEMYINDKQILFLTGFPNLSSARHFIESASYFFL